MLGAAGVDPATSHVVLPSAQCEAGGSADKMPARQRMQGTADGRVLLLDAWSGSAGVVAEVIALVVAALESLGAIRSRCGTSVLVANCRTNGVRDARPAFLVAKVRRVRGPAA